MSTLPTPSHRHAETTPRERLHRFLTERLTDELGRLWDRDPPGLAAQVAVVDDVLSVLATGSLPERHVLVILLVGYRTHPDYDPAWGSLEI